MPGFFIILAIIAFIAVMASLIKIVPEQMAYIVEQLGKYQKTLKAGMHILIPFIQTVAYKHILKEEVVDVAPQTCITKDNVQVEVDGILYLKVMDPYKASYGIDRYKFATIQLAQTTMRSELGKIELDRSFTERDSLNNNIVKAIDEASDPWGIKVTRYEIRDIVPSRTVQDAMEKQVRAERLKRAEILKSEGEKAARINVSIGQKEEAINLSKAERQKKMNEADGRAKAIELIAESTANGITNISKSINQKKGKEAVAFRIAEQFIAELGNILGKANISILPQDLAQLKGTLKSLITGIEGPKTVSQLLDTGKSKEKSTLERR
ncbi:MAG: paraslipin [Spirochaetales bacterium]|nr:paraslipin [Spirochaetales bacterium]